MAIHPTAIVDKAAEVHASVEVGAFSIIEAGVIVGENTTLKNNVLLKSGAIIGQGNIFHSNVVVSDAPQYVNFDLKTKSGVRIGNGNTFRENVTLHRSIKEDHFTSIGNDNYFMAGSHVGHDAIVHDNAILVNNVLLGGHSEVQDRAFISGNSAVHQFCRVGRLSMVGGVTRITTDVPPFSLCYGVDPYFKSLNLVGMRRAGFSNEVIKKIKNFYKEFYSHTPRESIKVFDDKKNSLTSEEKEILDFIVQNKKGILRGKPREIS